MQQTNNLKTADLYHNSNEVFKKQALVDIPHPTIPEIVRLTHELKAYQLELETQARELNLALKKAELQNENLYGSLFNANMTVMLLIDPSTGDIKDANPAACHYYGWSHQQFCTKNISQINVLAPEDILEEMLKAKVEMQTHFFFKHRLFNGEIRDVEVTSCPVQINNSKFLLSFIKDITEKKIAEEKLSKSEETYRKLVETINDVVYEITDKGVIRYVSPSIVRILGYSSEEVVGKNIVNFIYEDDRPMIMGLLSTLCEKGHVSFECRYICNDGDIKWVQASTSAIIEQGKLVGGTGILAEITQNKLTAETLRRNEAINRKMVENIGDVIVIFNGAGIITYKSQNVEKWFGWNPEDSVGVSIWKHICPDDLKLVQNFVKTLNEEPGATRKLEFRYQCKNARYKWIECTAVNLLSDPDIQGILANYHDITDRIEAEKQFKLLSKAIEQSPASVVITDKEGNIEYVNPKFTEITGYSLDEVEGKNFRFLKSEAENNEFYQNLWKTVLAGNDWHGELQNRKKNGDIYWENAMISPIVDSFGNIVFLLAIKEDITERKRMINDLIRAKDKAEESDRLKSAFLANMSHEIRTPMNGILGFTDLLKEPNLSGDAQKEYIKIIELSGARMLETINNIVDISKIESGQMTITTSEINISEQIESIFSFFRPTVEHKGIQFSLKNLVPVQEVNIKTDHQKLYVILSNLIKNAIKFTQKGSIEVGCSAKVTQTFTKELIFYVKDTGAGIPQENLNVIFERFRQGNESNSRGYEGSGLGLSISKAYIEMLGGRIWVESEEKKGSTFFFTIPYRAIKS